MLALLLAVTWQAGFALADDAPRGGRLLKFLQARHAQQDGAGTGNGVIDSVREPGGSGPGGGNGTKDVVSIDFEGRSIDLYIPDNLPPKGQRALLVVLHGGMGNSANVRRSLEMDGMADKYGFLIAYLNGNPIRLQERMKTWNAGECCGSSSRDKIDDVGYISDAIHMIEQAYGASPDRIYGMGHSNGAMMTQRVMCETGIYQAAVPVSGPLELAVEICPAAKGRRIMAIHGAEDVNVPVGGGAGQGIANVVFRSEAQTKAAFEKGGATYQLWLVPGADHRPSHIRDAISQQGGDMQEDVVKFLGLNN